VGAGLSAVGESIGRPEWLFKFIPAMLGGMFVLGIGMIPVLIAANKKLRNSPSSLTPPSAPTGEGIPSPSGEGKGEGDGVQ